jgi:outer membrane protein
MTQYFLSWFLACFLIAEARAADLSDATDGVTTVAPAVLAPWYVKLGAAAVIDQTSSNLYSQTLAPIVTPSGQLLGLAGVGPQQLLIGRGATYANGYTAILQAGYFLTSNWSLEMAAGFPVWLNVKVTGFSAAAPTSGTVLTKVLPAAVPITALYHFTQFGSFQPYLGAGFEPSFLLSLKSGFSTGGAFKPTVGLVFQSGFDYMFNPNWGFFLDAKKVFAESKGTATGIDLGPPVGIVPVSSTIKTSGQPWIVTSGLTYRF